MKSLAILTLAARLVSAGAPIGTPEIGFIQAGDKTFVPVRGIAANFVLSKPVVSGVVSAGFSGSFGVVKTAGQLIVTDQAGKAIASQPAPAGPGLIAFSLNGQPALVYLESTKTLLAWNAHSFVPTRFEASSLGAGSVVSIAAAAAGMAALLVQRSDGLWEVRIHLGSGAISSQAGVPGVSSPALLTAEGDVLYGDKHGIVIRKMDGSEEHVSAHLPGNFAFQPMGDGWVAISDIDSPRRYAVRVLTGRERFYALPEVGR